MKKGIFIFLFTLLIFVSCYNVYSVDYDDSEKRLYEEEIIPIRDNEGNLIGIDCVLVIPSDSDAKVIRMNPSIFGGINEYREVSGGKIGINLQIVNNSKNDYQYVENSFSIKTKEVLEKNNFDENLGIGFDGVDIYEVLKPYRSLNSALEALVIDDLSDESIGLKLKEMGYRGIDELDKYYVDFYNKKYSLNVTRLGFFRPQIIKEIFSGGVVGFYETDKEVIELAYNNFYNNILKIMTDENNINSFGNYIRGEVTVNRDFSVKAKSTSILNKISVIVDDEYMTDAYRSYQFFGDVEFKLKKNSE